MLKKNSLIFIVANLIVVLVFFGYKTVQKEEILNNGRLVLLPLAPVDPRSLMQGDYMILRYDGLSGYYPENHSVGYVVVSVTEDGVGSVESLVGLDEKVQSESGRMVIKYKKATYGDVYVGAESYFFEEGQAEYFEIAVYGGLKVDAAGNSVLVGLYDENRELIVPPTQESAKLVSPIEEYSE